MFYDYPNSFKGMKNCTRSLLSIHKWTCLTAFFLFFALLVMTRSALAKSEVRQSLQEITIDLTLRDRSLKEAFSLIKKKTGFKFVYNEELVAPYRVNIAVSRKPLDEVLHELLGPTRLDYREQKGTVVIVEKRPERPARSSKRRSCLPHSRGRPIAKYPAW
jgi:hypothetical protein